MHWALTSSAPISGWMMRANQAMYEEKRKYHENSQTRPAHEPSD